MKLLVLSSAVALSVVLSGCWIPIRVVPAWNPDLYNGYKVIQAYQKKDTIGHTDAAQRKQDAFDCGVIKYMDGDLDLSVQYPGMTTQEIKDRMLRISNCMESKGYIIDDPINCTDDGKPTGFCN